MEPDGAETGGQGGNGLSAQSYQPLADLEPALAAGMLEVLREEGVAARVTDEDAGLAAGESRLWADAAELDLARAVLRTRLPLLRAAADEPREEGPPRSPAARTDRPDPVDDLSPDREQAIWEQLVAGFDAPAVEPERPPRPHRPGRRIEFTKPTEAGDDTRPDAGPAPAPVPSATPLPREVGPRDWVPDEDDDEGDFVPPEPEPLPETDTATKFGWLMVLGGPGFLLFMAVFRPEHLAGWPAGLGVLLFLAGFATLVVRMKDHDPEDDDPDGGAVV